MTSAANQFRAAFVSLALEQIAALVVGADPFCNMQRDQLVSLVEKTACRRLDVSGWKPDTRTRFLRKLSDWSTNASRAV